MESDVNAETSPSCLGDLERWTLAGSKRVLVCVEDLELNFIEPSCECRIALRLSHVDSPTFGMVFRDAFGTVGMAHGWELPGFRAND